MRETDFFGRLLLVGLALGAGVGLGLLIAPARGDLTRERLSASARSAADAVYALGFVHAEERRWQMELNRRVGAGRLSEIFGKRTLATDRFVRTVGFERAAREALETGLEGHRSQLSGPTGAVPKCHS